MCQSDQGRFSLLIVTSCLVAAFGVGCGPNRAPAPPIAMTSREMLRGLLLRQVEAFDTRGIATTLSQLQQMKTSRPDWITEPQIDEFIRVCTISTQGKWYLAEAILYDDRDQERFCTALRSGGHPSLAVPANVQDTWNRYSASLEQWDGRAFYDLISPNAREMLDRTAILAGEPQLPENITSDNAVNLHLLSLVRPHVLLEGDHLADGRMLLEHYSAILMPEFSVDHDLVGLPVEYDLDSPNEFAVTYRVSGGTVRVPLVADKHGAWSAAILRQKVDITNVLARFGSGRSPDGERVLSDFISLLNQGHYSDAYDLLDVPSQRYYSNLLGFASSTRSPDTLPSITRKLVLALRQSVHRPPLQGGKAAFVSLGPPTFLLKPGKVRFRIGETQSDGPYCVSAELLDQVAPSCRLSTRYHLGSWKVQLQRLYAGLETSSSS